VGRSFGVVTGRVAEMEDTPRMMGYKYPTPETWWLGVRKDSLQDGDTGITRVLTKTEDRRGKRRRS
jgi:hypothetical protein